MQPIQSPTALAMKPRARLIIDSIEMGLVCSMLERQFSLAASLDLYHRHTAYAELMAVG